MLNIGIHKKLIVLQAYRKFSSTCINKSKVVVCGGCGGIGQPLSLLLKMNPLIKEVAVQDLVKHTPGVAKDLSHIEYPATVTGHIGPDGLKKALECANVVAVPAGLPRKPEMTRDDLFDANADLIKQVADDVAEICPKAMIVIVTNPINSVIPIACEAMKTAGKLDPKRIFGITTLDNVRAATFVAEKLRISPKDVNVPVIGGHSGVTIIPVFSKSYPKLNFPLEEIKELTKKVQDGGSEVVKAKAGAGSATLSTAYATARFINSLLRAMKGETNIVECAYIQTDVCPVIPYFAGPIVLGKNGAEKMCPIVDINDYEREQLSKAIPVLQKEIQKGIEYVKKKNCEKKPDPCASLKKADSDEKQKKSDPRADTTKSAGEKSDGKPDGTPSGVGAKCPPGSSDSKKSGSNGHSKKQEKGAGHEKSNGKPDPCADLKKKDKGAGHEKSTGKPDPCADLKKKDKGAGHEKSNGKPDPCADLKKQETCAESGKGKPDGNPSGVGAKCPPDSSDSKKSDPCADSKKQETSKKGDGKPDGSPSGVGAKCPPASADSKNSGSGADSKKSDPCADSSKTGRGQPSGKSR